MLSHMIKHMLCSQPLCGNHWQVVHIDGMLPANKDEPCTQYSPQCMGNAAKVYYKFFQEGPCTACNRR